MSSHNHNSLQFEGNENDFGSSLMISPDVLDRSSSILEEITNIEVEPSSIKSDLTGIVLPSRQQTDAVQQNECDLESGPKLVLQSYCKSKQRIDAYIFDEAQKTNKVNLAEALLFVPQEYDILSANLCKNNTEERHEVVTLNNCTQKDKMYQVLSVLRKGNRDVNIAELQLRLDMISGNLEEAHTINCQNQEKLWKEGKLESNIQTSHLLEEVVVLQSKLLEKLCSMTKDNEKLRSEVVAKENKMKEMNTEWEKASLELTSFLLDGSKSLRDATNQIEDIAGSFAHVNIGICEHIENAAKYCVEKEEKILLLERSLEDAQKTVTQMEQNLISLRGAAIVLTELQQLEHSSGKESIQMTTTLNDKHHLCREAQIFKKHKSAASSLFEINMETECTRIILGDNEDYRINGTPATLDTNRSFLLGHSEIQSGLEKLPERDSGTAIGGQFPGKNSCLLGSHALNSKCQQGLKSGHNQSIFSEMIGVLQPADLVLHEADASCCRTMKLVADGKVSTDCRFFIQFEEACATMQEAEIMINVLLKEIENSTVLASKCMQSRDILMEEKANLVEENKQLRISLHLKDEENERLHDQSRDSLEGMSKMISSLEKSFLDMQRDTEAMCKAIYSDAFMSVKELQSIIHFSRSSVEDIYAHILEEEFASFVLNQFSASSEYSKNLKKVDGLLVNYPDRFQDCINNELHITMIGDEVNTSLNSEKRKKASDQTAVNTTMEAFEMGLNLDDKVANDSELKEELEPIDIEIMLEDLLQEFSKLQKSASTTEILEAETENLVPPLSQAWYEIQIKKSQLDFLVVQIAKHKRFFDTDNALFASNSDIEQFKEKGETIQKLEKKVNLAKSSLDGQLLSLLDSIENDLKSVTEERDQLGKQVVSLQDRLERPNALATENKGIVVKAHQDVEASKIHTEQKEEEVKILKQLVRELEGTINVLEKKGYEMEEELRRHQQLQDPLKIEFQPQQQWTINSTNKSAQDQLIRELHCRSLELHEARNRILSLEAELSEQSEEIKWCKGYISELVLHAEAQASQYQQKYKMLEAMVREVKTESSNMASASPNVDKMEKRSMRTRRSSSPFRCVMGGLVQQKNVVKDQELSTAMLRIQELEDLLVSRQKEVCLLNTRLAATENMTHDIIRDLLGVKLDMTNYANMMDHQQFKRIVKDTQQQSHKSRAMEKEILKMRRQINDLIEERDICIIEVNRREADICAIQMDVEQIQEREQLLTTENVLLKTEKINLHRRVAELDNMVKKVFGTQTNQPRVQQQIDCLLKSSSTDFRERPRNTEKQLRGVNDELSQYFKPESSCKQANLGRR